LTFFEKAKAKPKEKERENPILKPININIIHFLLPTTICGAPDYY
jgi:hypothetical protein